MFDSGTKWFSYCCKEKKNSDTSDNLNIKLNLEKLNELKFKDNITYNTHYLTPNHQIFDDSADKDISCNSGAVGLVHNIRMVPLLRHNDREWNGLQFSPKWACYQRHCSPVDGSGLHSDNSVIFFLSPLPLNWLSTLEML